MFELPVQLILTMFFVLLLIANGYLQLRILKRKNLRWLWEIIAWLMLSIWLTFAIKHFSAAFNFGDIDNQDIRVYLHFFLLFNFPLEIAFIVNLINHGIRIIQKKNHENSHRNEKEISDSENG